MRDLSQPYGGKVSGEDACLLSLRVPTAGSSRESDDLGGEQTPRRPSWRSRWAGQSDTLGSNSPVVPLNTPKLHAHEVSVPYIELLPARLSIIPPRRHPRIPEFAVNPRHIPARAPSVRSAACDNSIVAALRCRAPRWVAKYARRGRPSQGPQRRGSTSSGPAAGGNACTVDEGVYLAHDRERNGFRCSPTDRQTDRCAQP
jgi:hypothetical protein